MKMPRFYLLVVILAGGPLLWQPLRGQPQGENKGANKAKRDSSLTTKNTALNQFGTKDSPMFVDILGRQKSADETAQDRKADEYKRAVDIWTLSIAGLIALLTGGLVVIGYFGVRYAKKTLDAIKTQGEQADRHLMMTERPWIGTVSLADGDMRPDGPERHTVHTVVMLTNTGRSVALRGLMMPFLISTETVMLPNEIKRVWQETEQMLSATGRAEWATGFVLHPGSTQAHEVYMGTGIPMNELRNGRGYVLVCVVYRDQFDKVHRTQDCFRMTMPNPQGMAVRFEMVPASQTAD